MLLMAKNVRCKLEFAQCHQDWTFHDWYRENFSDEAKINRFSVMVALGVGLGTENLNNYKLIL